MLLIGNEQKALKNKTAKSGFYQTVDLCCVKWLMYNTNECFFSLYTET